MLVVEFPTTLPRVVAAPVLAAAPVPSACRRIRAFPRPRCARVLPHPFLSSLRRSNEDHDDDDENDPDAPPRVATKASKRAPAAKKAVKAGGKRRAEREVEAEADDEDAWAPPDEDEEEDAELAAADEDTSDLQPKTLTQCFEVGCPPLSLARSACA